MSAEIDNLNLDQRTKDMLNMLHETTRTWNSLKEFEYNSVLGGRTAKSKLDEAYSELVRAIERELGYALHGALKDSIDKRNRDSES